MSDNNKRQKKFMTRIGRTGNQLCLTLPKDIVKLIKIEGKEKFRLRGIVRTDGIIMIDTNYLIDSKKKAYKNVQGKIGTPVILQPIAKQNALEKKIDTPKAEIEVKKEKTIDFLVDFEETLKNFNTIDTKKVKTDFNKIK